MLFPLGWLLAHVTRLVEIGKVLRARGHEVVFAGENPDRYPHSRMGIARDAGFRIVHSLEPDFPYAWGRFEKYGWIASAWDIITHERWAALAPIIESQLRVIEDERPDMLIGDASISVSTCAYIKGLPAAGVMNAYVTRFTRRTSVFLPLIHGMDRLRFEPQRRQVYRRYGVKPVNALELLRSIPLVSPDLPGLYDVPSKFPNWHMVGPILAQPTVARPDWWDELDDGQPNVYVTMGSTGLIDTFLERTYGALAREPYRFLLTTAGQASARVLAAAPSNFRVAKYAPGNELVHRCKALVFHGGNGTMYQGLAAGLPMIGLPSHLEQHINFEIAVKRGFGVKFSPRRVRGERLARTLREMIENPVYAERARRYADVVTSMNGAVGAADIFERTAREGKPAGWNLR